MARRIHVNRLAQDELVYELTIRGIATGNETQIGYDYADGADWRHLKYPEYPYTFEKDSTVVDAKLKELRSDIEAFSGGKKSGEYLKWQSKLAHVLNRLDNMPTQTDKEKNKAKSEWVALALTLMKKLTDKSSAYDRQAVVHPQLDLVETEVAGAHQSGAGSDSDVSQEEDDSFAGDLNRAVHSSTVPRVTAVASSSKSVPPTRWGLQFTGDKRGLSLSAFLERVEGLCIARRVAKDSLLDAEIDLFSSNAYQFFVAYRSEVTSWDEFTVLLREEFQPQNYNEKLFEEIRRRTQGPDESIGIYLAIMSGYFRRLTCPIFLESASLSGYYFHWTIASVG